MHFLPRFVTTLSFNSANANVAGFTGWIQDTARVILVQRGLVIGVEVLFDRLLLMEYFNIAQPTQ